MKGTPDKIADSTGVDFVIFCVNGWRVAFEARQIRSSSIAQEAHLCKDIEALLGFSPAGSKTSPTPRQCLRIKGAEDNPEDEKEFLVNGPVDLVCLPVAAIYPLPPLLAARTRLHGLRALALEPETATKQITLLFNSHCLADNQQKERDSLTKDTDAIRRHQKDDAV